MKNLAKMKILWPLIHNGIAGFLSSVFFAQFVTKVL